MRQGDDGTISSDPGAAGVVPGMLSAETARRKRLIYPEEPSNLARRALPRLASGRLCSGDGHALARLPGIFVADEQGFDLPQQIVSSKRLDQHRS